MGKSASYENLLKQINATDSEKLSGYNAELLDEIHKAGEERQKKAIVNLNWPQAVLRVRYADGAALEEVHVQEANEGERE